MAGLSQNPQILEAKEVTPEQINQNLDSLEAKTRLSGGYEIKEIDGENKILLQLNGQTLNIPLEQEQIPGVIKLITDTMEAYKKAEYTDNLYAIESSFSRGDPNMTSKIDLRVDNRITKVFDSTVLLEEVFNKATGLNPDRNNGFMEEFARFLNASINLKINPEK